MKKKLKKKFLDERRFVITQMRRFDYGREFISRIIAPVSFVISVFTLLKVYDIGFTFETIGIIIAAAVVFMFALGYAYDRLGFVEEEIEYNNERNRFVKAVLQRMDHKKQWVGLLRKSRIR